MAQTIPNFNHAYQFNALDTYNYTIQTAGNHLIAVKATAVASTTPNQVTIVINKNGSPIATLVPNTSPNPNEMNLSALNNCTVNDTISVVFTSTKVSDAGPNRIRGLITITMNV